MESILSQFAQYGLLGLICAIAMGALAYVFKMLISQVEKRLDQTQKDLEVERQNRIELQKRFDDYISQDRTQIIDLLKRISPVIERLEKKV